MGVLKNDVGRPPKKVIKIRLILKLISLFLMIGTIFGIAYYFRGGKVEVKKEVKKYVILDNIKEINLNVVDSLDDIYIVVDDNYNYTLVDINGNKIIDEVYDLAHVEAGFIIASKNNTNKIIDKTGKILYDNVHVGNQMFHSDDYLLIYNSNHKLGLLDKKGNLVKEFKYDDAWFQNNYYLMFINGKTDVYDSKMNLLLEGVEIVQRPSMDLPQYEMNDNFILIKKGDKYQVYYAKTKKNSKEYEYVSLAEKYVLVNDKNKTFVLNNRGKTITEYSKKYVKPQFVTKDILFVQNESCPVSEETLNYKIYGELYNSEGKKIFKGCNEFSRYDDISYIIDKDNNIYLYNEEKQIYNKKIETEGVYAYSNEYGNVVLADKNTQLFDKNGNQILEECKFVGQLSEKIFMCSSIWNMQYIVDNKFNFIEEKPYFSAYNDHGFVKLTSHDDKYGLLDADGNKILDEKYDNIIVTKNNILIKYNEKTYIMKIKYVNKDTKKEHKKKDINIKEQIKSLPNYNSIDVNNIIGTYKLENIMGLINSDKELFKKFAYHTINNQNITFEDKKNLLELFQVVIDYNKREDISKLFDRIDALKIKIYKTRPSNMNETATGHYIDSSVLIEIIEEHYYVVIKHELIHLISNSLGSQNETIYYCDGKFKSAKEIINMTYKEQKHCVEKNVNFNKNRFIEEANAELISDSLYEKDITRAYNDSVELYLLLQHILEDDLLNVYYNTNRNLEFTKLMNKKLGYEFEATTDLLNKLDILPSSSYTASRLEHAYNLYVAADEIIEAYEAKKVGNFKDNDLINLVLYNMLKEYKLDVQQYLKNNPDKSLKNYNKLMLLEFDENKFLKETLKADDIYSYVKKLKNEDGKIVMYYLVSADSKTYDVNIYFDKYGKVNDIKKVEHIGGLG